MIDQEMLDALRQLSREETTNIIKTETPGIVKEEKKVTEQQFRDEIRASSQQSTEDMAALVEALFMKQFNLLADKIDSVMCKMPSKDHMDTIKRTLQKQGEILKAHDQKIEKQKISLQKRGAPHT